jgi:6,7-dimethyl-8-ribityllumazine synthase
MADKKKNLSEISFTPHKQFSPQQVRIGVVVSQWNNTITDALLEGALDTLQEYKVPKGNITVRRVPGSFELPSAAVMMLEADEKMDAVICLGCIIQGETRHFEFIAQAVADGIMKAAIDYATPVIFGVLTCNDMQQAIDRSGGKHGNKGTEAAVSCLQMIDYQKSLC